MIWNTEHSAGCEAEALVVEDEDEVEEGEALRILPLPSRIHLPVRSIG